MTNCNYPSYHVTAEHCGGKSVGHPCTKGVYDDATELLDCVIGADDPYIAEKIGLTMLWKMAADSLPCNCSRRLKSGGKDWWESVAIVVEPVS